MAALFVKWSGNRELVEWSWFDLNTFSFRHTDFSPTEGSLVGNFPEADLWDTPIFLNPSCGYLWPTPSLFAFHEKDDPQDWALLTLGTYLSGNGNRIYR